MTDDPRLYAPATARNREPIFQVLKPNLPDTGLVLEIASGTGEHITHFAQETAPDLMYQPTDPDPASRKSIDAWTAALGLLNVRPAIALDASSESWPVTSANVVLCINMTHIAPFSATIGLMKGAARILPTDGVLFLYGPFRRNGRHTAPSNEQFDQSLRRTNPSWGLRDVEDLVNLAHANNLTPPLIEEMPANNQSLVFRPQN